MFARNGCSRDSRHRPLGRDIDLWGSLSTPGDLNRPLGWFVCTAWMFGMAGRCLPAWAVVYFLSGKNFPSISACRHIGWGLKFLFGQKSPSKSGLSSNPMVLESLSGKNFPSIPACRLIRWCMKCLTGHKLSIQIQTSIKSDGEQVFKTPNWAPSKSGLKPNPMVSKP